MEFWLGSDFRPRLRWIAIADRWIIHLCSFLLYIRAFSVTLFEEKDRGKYLKNFRTSLESFTRCFSLERDCFLRIFLSSSKDGIRVIERWSPDLVEPIDVTQIWAKG